MMWFFFSLVGSTALGGTGSDGAWAAMVARLSSPFEARWTPEEAQREAARLCDLGRRDACRLELGESLETVLEEACVAGDEAACLGRAWQRQDAEPKAAFLLFDELCEAGWGRACASRAQARLDGVGTWTSRYQAREEVEALCRTGFGEGCVVLAMMEADRRPGAQLAHLHRAQRLGASGAPGRIAQLAPPGPGRDGALVDACGAGSREACWELATMRHGSEPDAYADRACALGYDRACVSHAALAFEEERVGAEGAAQILDGHCKNGMTDACIAASIFRNGGRVHPFPTGDMGPVQRRMTMDEKVPVALGCYRDRLERGEHEVLELVLELATDADGIFIGVTGRTDDEDLEQCLAEGFLGTPGQKPHGGPARFDVTFTLSHEAQVNVDPIGLDDATTKIGLMEWRLVSQVGLDANLCYLDLGGSAFDKQFAIFRGTLSREGWYEHEGVIESTGDEATDRCLATLVSRVHVPEIQLPFDQAVEIRFDFNHMARSPRWAGWGPLRGNNAPPLDLSRYNSSSQGSAARSTSFQ